MDPALLLERERELDAIGDRLAAARESGGGALLIEGAAGIGKSSLLTASRAAAGDFRVVGARGSELEHDFPLGIARQLLGPVLIAASDDERSKLLSGAGAIVQRVLGPPDGAHDEIGETEAVLHGLYWFTANLASRQPLLMLVDDAQWADLTSLRWLAYLVARIEGLPLALLVTVRLGEPTAGQDLLDDLAADPRVHVLKLEGLSEAAVAPIAERTFGHAPDADFARASHQATAGNPFLLGELLVDLERRGVAPVGGSASLIEAVTPTSVGRDLRTRLRRLPPACRALARAIAVLGDGTSLRVGAQLAEQGEAVASNAADALASAGILESGRPLAFVHPLIRASVYGELSAGEQAVWHGRAAALLTGAEAPSDWIAVHLLASEPAGDLDAVEVLRDAAGSARRRGAAEVAVAYLRRALREPPPPELAAPLTVELGKAEIQAVEIEPAIEHLRDAIPRLSDPRPQALAAAELGTALAFTNRPVDGVAVLNDAIARLPEDERELGLLLQVTRAMVAPVSLDAWRLMTDAGHRYSALEEDPATPGERLHVAELALQAALKSTADRARSLALAALADGGLLDDPGPLPLLVFKAPLALLWADALEDASAVFGRLLSWAQGHGSAMTFAQASHMRAWARWLQGSLLEAEADAENALRHPSPQLRPAALMLVEIRLAQGNPEAAADVWGEAGLEADHGRGRAEVVPLQTRARLRAAQGRVNEALADLERCGELEEAWELRTPALSSWRNDATRLLVALGRPEEAKRLAAEELDRSLAFGAPRHVGLALRSSALVADRKEGITLLEEAVGFLEQSPARLEQSLTLCELGAALRRAGQRSAARDPLRSALELALVCGAGAVATRAHDELVAAGARPRRDPIESRSTLTASELRVARMAADGMTNREIAQALFLTEKTIENHLGSTYRKLEIRSRSQLARALPPTPEAAVV